MKRLKPTGRIRTAYDLDNDPYLFEATGEEAKHFVDILKAEDEGRLVVLPCKVDDTVYVITKNGNIKECTICGAIIDPNNIWLDAKEGIYGGGLLNSSQFGIDVFLSRDDAEKALTLLANERSE